MGEETNGDRMEETCGCFGTNVDCINDGCNERKACLNCILMIEGVKELPAGVKGAFYTADGLKRVFRDFLGE